LFWWTESLEIDKVEIVYFAKVRLSKAHVALEFTRHQEWFS